MLKLQGESYHRREIQLGTLKTAKEQQIKETNEK